MTSWSDLVNAVVAEVKECCGVGVQQAAQLLEAVIRRVHGLQGRQHGQLNTRQPNTRRVKKSWLKIE